MSSLGMHTTQNEKQSVMDEWEDEMSWQENKWKYADKFYDELAKANQAMREELKEQVKV